MNTPPDPRALLTDALAALHEAEAVQQEAAKRLEAASAAIWSAPSLGGRREPPNPEHAQSYQDTANMLRRRAKRQTPDLAAETERRADYFERRAQVKRDGGVMPRDLRSPTERMGFVDAVRQTLLLLLESCEQIDLPDVVTFVDYLTDEEGRPLHGDATEEAARLAVQSIASLRQELPALLEQLGMGRTAEGVAGFWPAEVPLAAAAESMTRPEGQTTLTPTGDGASSAPATE